MQKTRQTGKRRLFLSESHSWSCFTELRANSEEVGVMTNLLYKKKKLADGQTAERYLVKLANIYSNKAKLKF